MGLLFHELASGGQRRRRGQRHGFEHCGGVGILVPPLCACFAITDSIRSSNFSPDFSYELVSDFGSSARLFSSGS